MAKAAKRVGRPIKPAKGAARASLGLKVTSEVKRVIEALALASGRTQSQQTEYMVERALQYDRTMEAMRATLESLEKDNVEAVLSRKGWRLVHMTDQHAKAADLWAPPGHPWNPRSGFLSDEELNAWRPGGVPSKAKAAEEKVEDPQPSAAAGDEPPPKARNAPKTRATRPKPR
jgi:hypothetical protein